MARNSIPVWKTSSEVFDQKPRMTNSPKTISMTDALRRSTWVTAAYRVAA